jgi:regulator of cell morphogenesis and NO signaling
MYTKRMKLAEVLQSDYNTLNVINRFGIALGFGEKSVEMVCSQYGINPNFFLEIINAYHDPDYFPQKHLQSFSVGEIVEYLKKTHQSYLNQDIPYIERLMNELLEGCRNPKEINLVLKFFTDYKKELFKHLQWEDEQIFPYSISIENAYKNEENINDVLEQAKTYSMNTFLDEHDDIESKLYDINTLFIKYIPPVENQQLCLRILKEFAHLERDINNHARIEEKVLAPKVAEMEKALLKRYE